MILSLIGLVAQCGCSIARREHPVPVPAGAVAAALLSHQRVAVLAGNDASKGVFIIDLASGTIKKSFGVTREATGIDAVTDNGPLLVSIGENIGDRSFGAVEQWTLEGIKKRVIPLPSEGLGITRAVNGTVYVLLASTGDARAALPIDITVMRVGSAVPLEARARTLQQCQVGSSTYLAYTDGPSGTVTVRDLRTGNAVHSSVVADGPECGSDGRVYAIAKGLTSRTIVVLSAPQLDEIGTIPVANDAAALYMTSDHRLLELDANPQVASIEVVPTQVQ
jgi:hypothetical protein